MAGIEISNEICLIMGTALSNPIKRKNETNFS